jgi:MFS family permease
VKGFALVKVVFPPEQLRQALIPFGPVMGLATVAGPILAGWLLHLDLFGSQWRSIFLINVPIGVVAWALGWWVLPHRSGEDAHARLDPGGAGLLTAASVLLIIPLVQGRELGWPWWCYLSMAGSIIALALFVVSERRSRHPVITPSLFGKRSFVAGLAIVGAFFASLSGFQLAFNLLLQLGWHRTPLHTSLTRKLGRATIQLGLGIAVIGLLALWWTIARRGDSLTSWTLAPSLLLIGSGTGLVFVPIFDFILGDASTEEVGTAAFDHAAELVIGLAAVLYLITFALVWLLPKHATGDL